ncbi:type II secretion protein [Halobacteriales archaeon QH_2_65_14]|nr:MAG: type II secretion protein [Halobacteriales archaeon QH_2_65_14]
MPDLTTRLPESVRSVLGSGESTTGCGCEPSFDDGVLVVDATECQFGGQLEASPECREAVIGSLTERDATAVRTETGGVERAYEDDAAALLVAAGRFVETAAFHDQRLADRARSDPLAACREATGRADAVADVAAETGLAELTARAGSYETALSPYVGPTVSHWRVETTPPPGTRLTAVRELETGATVRHYDPDGKPPRYFLEPVERQLPEHALATLAEAYRRLANGEVDGGDRAPARAVRAVVADRYPDDSTDAPADGTGGSETPGPVAEQVRRVLEKHARGYGLLEDLFADPGLSDAFVTAPAPSNRLRVTVDGETLVTNVKLTGEGVAALSSRFRRESGRAFSRADPTLDATAEVASRRIRIAGVTEPPSTGTAFAFRAQDREVWTLPALVANGTISADGAALLSVGVERGSAILLAGPRGAGKTTMLGALLWELPPAVRTVVIEDTPELPVAPLQESGRDVQALLASGESEELSPAQALRTALRLGDGALAVGEVRGEEAGVLYEAMRVGASSEAVLGTIHGHGGESVYERVVTDLGVPSSAFGVTDLVVTLESTAAGVRRVSAIEEVIGGDPPGFETLFERTNEGLASTHRIDRGNSRVVASLATPEESYADVRERLATRARLLDALADRNATDGDTVTEACANRQR